MSSENWQKSLNTIYERNQYLLESQVLSDIVFLFKNPDDEENEPESIHAHKFELAKGSSVFEKMFYGNTENITEMDIKDVGKKSFYEMIKFLYLEEIEVNAENALDILNLSKTYDIDALELNYSNFITANMSVDNVCKLLENSLKQNNVSLKIKCVKFIEENTSEVLQHSSLIDVNKKTLHVLIDINPKDCGPMASDFFNAAIKWAKNQCKITEIDSTAKNIREVLGNLFYLICFPNMANDEFIQCLEDDQLFTIEEIGQIFLYIHLKKKRDIKFKVQKKHLKSLEDLLLQTITFGKHNLSQRNNSEQFVLTFTVNKLITLEGLQTEHGFDGNIQIRMCNSREILYSTSDPSQRTDIKLEKPIKIRPNIEYEIVMTSYNYCHGYEVTNKEYTLEHVTLTTIANPQYPWSPISQINFTRC